MEIVQGINLSHSSASQILGCQQKYFYRKVAQVPVDTDHEEADYLSYGKALHKILEDCDHIVPSIDWLWNKLDEVCKEFNVESFEHRMGIYLSAIKYSAMHKDSGLTIVATELMIDQLGVIGYIDGVLANHDKKEFWIMDLKTAAFKPDDKLNYLHKDPQLNLYSYFATVKPDIPAVLGLDDYKFMGCRYRVCTKSRHKRKSTDVLPEKLPKETVKDFRERIKGMSLQSIQETEEEFLERISDSIEIYDIVVPFEHMEPLQRFEEHQEVRNIAIALNNGQVPLKNRGNCMAYNKPCEYWSRCHGQNFSQNPLCKTISKLS